MKTFGVVNQHALIKYNKLYVNGKEYKTDGISKPEPEKKNRQHSETQISRSQQRTRE